jgi:hypothetical protein
MKWNTKRTIEELVAGGGMKMVVVVNADEVDINIKTLEVLQAAAESRNKAEVEMWKNAALCEKPRGACRLCETRNCYFKGDLVV